MIHTPVSFIFSYIYITLERKVKKFVLVKNPQSTKENKMKEETRKAAIEAIANYNDDSDLHGREASLEHDGTVMIRMWRNRNCFPEIYKGIPVVKFINMSKQKRQLPHWQYIQNFGYHIENGCCGKY